MKCQILFFGKNKKNTLNLLSAELAKSGYLCGYTVSGVSSVSVMPYLDWP